MNQLEKTTRLRALHYQETLLVLPNIWDPLGAALLQHLNFPAVATASASIAFTNGYDDGEHISFERLLAILQRIVESVTVPVTADIESGFAGNDAQLRENTMRLLTAGVAGINIEDVDKATNTLWPAEVQCDKIRLIKSVANEVDLDLFVNARTDVYLRGQGFVSPEEKLSETIRRGHLYKVAGADCLYPIALTNESDIAVLCKELGMPVNLLALQGIPALSKLRSLGVARLSLGPGFLKIAVRAMRDVAMKLHNFEGLQEIVDNDITSAFLKELATRSS